MKSNKIIPSVKAKKKDSDWKLEIHQLDIGQGDSALILFKKLNRDIKKYEVDKAILIDGGKSNARGYIKDYLDSKIGGNYAQIKTALDLKQEDLLTKEKEYRTLNEKLNTPTKGRKDKQDGTPNPEKQRIIDQIATVVASIAKDRRKKRALTLALSQEGLKALDAVIITHDDIDHAEGILEMVKQKDIYLNDNTKFIIHSGKEGGGDVVYGRLKNFIQRDILNQADKDLAVRKRIIFGYNKIGQNIWMVLEQPKPDSAPSIEFLAADGFFKGGELDLHVRRNRVDFALMEDDNNGSVVSLVSMDNFRYYTAGDFETNRNLIEYLQLKEELSGGVIKYFPIQAFLVPHHGSKMNFPGAKSENTLFVDGLGARAALISASGTGGYNHPHEETTNTLDKSNASFTYLTNKATQETSKKFIVPTRDDIGESKGTIKVQTYQNIAGVDKEKFMVKYKNEGSKTRDYYKDKDYTVLKMGILGRIPDPFRNTLIRNNRLKVSLSKTDLEFFLDEGNLDGHERKLKHLNPATIKEFFENYDPNDAKDGYSLSISIAKDSMSFDIGLKSPTVTNSKSTGRFPSPESATNLFERVKNFDGDLSRNKVKIVGLYLSKDELNQFLSGGSLTPLVEKRERDPIRKGDLFLELIDPNGASKIPTNIIERKIFLRKEYYKDVKKDLAPNIPDGEEPNPITSRVIARRIEYGDVQDRII